MIPLDNSLSIWKYLKQRGGLDLSRNPNGNDGYDVDLELRLNDALYTGQSGTLTENLEKFPVPVERFIAAFLRAQIPFSMMMVDILGLFERAGAQYGTANLKIEFNFVESDKLGLDLDHFREWTTSLQKVVTMKSLWAWDAQTCWKMVHPIRDLFQKGDWTIRFEVRDEGVRRWREALGLDREGRFLSPPRIPRSGDEALDTLISRCEAMIADFHRDCLSLAPTHEDLRHRNFSNAASSPERNDAIRQTASDYWAASFAEALAILSERVGEVRGSLDPLLGLLSNLMDSMYVGSSEVEELKESLEALLTLPSWERRHEVYAVWVAAQITTAFTAEDVQTVFHIQNNVLSFPFSGAHLATFFTAQPAAFLFWTELRSNLPSKSKIGRSKIQPDYRILHLPYDPVKGTILVVECKQYRRSSTRNFSHALNDYAIGCPNAHVILVNNGPIGAKVVTSIKASHASRTETFPHLQPDSIDVMERFRQTVRRVVLGTGKPSVKSAKLKNKGGAIRLAWGPSFNDLDLYVVMRSAESDREMTIYFRNKGDQASWPWIELLEDVKQGPGEEIILVSQWENATYDVYVHNYTSGTSLDSPPVTVTVEHPALFEAKRISSGATKAASGLGRCWHACSVDGISGRVGLIDRYYNDLHAGIPLASD